jgi:hypothetical protein
MSSNVAVPVMVTNPLSCQRQIAHASGLPSRLRRPRDVGVV